MLSMQTGGAQTVYNMNIAIVMLLVDFRSPVLKPKGEYKLSVKHKLCIYWLMTCC